MKLSVVLYVVVSVLVGLQSNYEGAQAECSNAQAQSSASAYYFSNGNQPQSVAYNNGYNRGYNSYTWSYNVCPGESDLVTYFANTFYWEFMNDPFLSTALSIDDVTPEEVAEMNAKGCYENDEIGEEEKRTLAEINHRAILENFGRATLQSLVFFYGTNSGEYLELNGVLTRDNVPYLVHQSQQYMVQAIQSSDNSPLGRLRAAGKGLDQFWTSINQTSPSKFAVLVALYSNNLYRLL